MPIPIQTALQKYYEKLRLLEAFGSAHRLMSWDQDTHMPKGAAPDRGESMSVLSGYIHQLFTDAEFVATVNELNEHQNELDPVDRRSVVVTKRDLDKSVKLPQSFVEETQSITNAAHMAWLEAKQQDNFPLYEPHLEKIIENRKKYASYLNPNQDPYDVNLDDYEEGLTTAQLEPLFLQVKNGIKELLPQILAHQSAYADVKNPLDQFELDHHVLETFIREMLQQIGFNWSRGGFGVVEHPFEISISANDVRLNTKFEKMMNSFTVTGIIHELGHGLYEQNVDPKYAKTALGHGVSLGIHESQSRLLENLIGRRTAFWTYFFPKLQSYFPQLKSATVENLVMALNRVNPSLIRTEADEVTYNLHVILRFELEKDLMSGKLAVKDVAEAWRSKMKELLDVEPQNHKEGVLQDVHWSWGNIGYFPTYTLGNLNAAQLWSTFIQQHPNWEAEITMGNFTSYFNWFKEKVWQHGGFYTPEELMKNVTGENTNAKYFLEYLKQKYLA